MPKIKFNRSSIPKQQPLPQMVGKKHTTCAAIKMLHWTKWTKQIKAPIVNFKRKG